MIGVFLFIEAWYFITEDGNLNILEGGFMYGDVKIVWPP